jgi:hypothetical protein
VVAILVIGYKNNKKEAVSKLVVGAITALAIMNIAIVMTIS